MIAYSTDDTMSGIIREAIPYATHILHMDKEYFFGTAEAYRQSEFGKEFLA